MPTALKLRKAAPLLRSRLRSRVVSSTSADPTHAAAICYRRTASGLEILLVRTKTGAWTFPKGRIEDEHSAAAALREAREEAGVHGRITHSSFEQYLHWKSSGLSFSRGRVSVVDAHLMQVLELFEPEERHRQPEWFEPTVARRLLLRGRHRVHRQHLDRVLLRALKLLNAI